MEVYDTSGPMNMVRPESVLETDLLSAKVVGSKICYQVIGGAEDAVGLKIFLVDSGSSWIKLKEGTASLKIFPDDFEKSSYILRVALDAFSINNGCLPLHAASMKVGNKTIILFGNSFCGKSTVMHHYCSRFLGTPVGDDHLVIRGDCIVGNAVTRIRGSHSGERFVTRKMTIQSLSEYLIFVVRLSNENSCEKISQADFFQRYDYRKCVLKYFSSALIENDAEIPLDKLVDISLEDPYQSKFADFIAKSDGIYFLSGSLRFLLEEIERILHKDSDRKREELLREIKQSQLSRSKLSLKKVSSTC